MRQHSDACRVAGANRVLRLGQHLSPRGYRPRCVSRTTPFRRVGVLSGGRWGWRPGGWTVIRLDAPWQDTPSSERPGWRERAANLDGDIAFAVDYLVCARCGFGWVEGSYTMGKCQRCGLAAAGLEALRLEYAGSSRAHERSRRPAWDQPRGCGEQMPPRDLEARKLTGKALLAIS